MRTVLVAAALALLAGCASEPTFAAVHATDTAAGGGILVRATVDSAGDRLTIRVHAENVGSRTWSVPSSCSGGGAAEPWSIGAVPDRAHDPRTLPIYPAEGCGDVVLGSFPPGAERDAEFTWDGSYVHDDEVAHASPGPYTLEATLEVYSSEDQAPMPIVVGLPVEVLR